MHQINAYNGQNFPRHHLIFAVTKVQHNAGGDDFRDCEHEVMFEVIVEVLVVVAEVGPPGVVVGIQVNKVQAKHAGPQFPTSHQWNQVFDALISQQNEHNRKYPDTRRLPGSVEINMFVWGSSWILIGTSEDGIKACI